MNNIIKLLKKYKIDIAVALISIIFIILFLDKENRKSIPLSYFKEKGYLLKEKLRPLVDYLEAVERDLG